VAWWVHIESIQWLFQLPVDSFAKNRARGRKEHFEISMPVVGGWWSGMKSNFKSYVMHMFICPRYVLDFLMHAYIYLKHYKIIKSVCSQVATYVTVCMPIFIPTYQAILLTHWWIYSTLDNCHFLSGTKQLTTRWQNTSLLLFKKFKPCVTLPCVSLGTFQGILHA